MSQPIPAKKLIIRRSLGHVVIGVLLAIGPVILASTSGCARRAYTDVYVDNMASEIRDLEDQLYEFDSEYRVLEQELMALKAENSRLRSAPSSTETGRAKFGSPQPLPLPIKPLDRDPVTPRSPSDSSRINPSPAPALDYAPSTTGPNSITPFGNPPPSNTPSNSARPNSSAIDNPATNTPMPLRDLPESPSNEPMELKDLIPPSIERGEAMPPILPAPKIDPSSPLTDSRQNDLELELGQVHVPGQLASSPLNGGRLLPANEMPADTRIVDIKFHPSMCRAVNTDNQGDDDGLVLVLQPTNEQGQFVPQAADLLVVVIDPSRNDSTARIGKWSYSTAEVKTKLQPMGTSQGIYLSVQWNGPAPGADRVIVFVYYTLPDGRRLVSEQDIFINNAHRQNTVWVPRSKPLPSDGPGPVQTVSGVRPVR